MRRSLRVVCRDSLAATPTAAVAKKRPVKDVKVEVKEEATAVTKPRSSSSKRIKKEPIPSPDKEGTTPEPPALASKKASKKELEKAAQLDTYLSFIHTRREQTGDSNKLVGAHVSGASGLENAVFNAAKIGARAFAFFTRSQRTWTCKPLTPDTIAAFHAAMKRFGYAPGDVVPHGSYLLNCGSPDAGVLQKSRDGLLDEVRRCEALGLTLYNFHPGATKNEISVDECLDLIAESIEQTLQQTTGVTILVENMSNQGCKTMAEFEATVGFKYLKAVHLNDSKGDVGCHADRHEKIGRGRVGLEPFRRLMNDPRFNHIPMIIETPYVDDDGYEEEISLLYSLHDNDKPAIK
ncbi:hypothetical protein DYB36_004160 [Aphanomyces astaci]|uniref:Xylose isomerase-like TIM barrel domain-containing protein n=3 Tax=Aphanomyces astaci TaxID=112090 RepID=A0A397AE82_APHAT|nr:hypothetical protein DYB36_004160 [Aphanomyces astaci]